MKKKYTTWRDSPPVVPLQSNDCPSVVFAVSAAVASHNTINTPTTPNSTLTQLVSAPARTKSMMMTRPRTTRVMTETASARLAKAGTERWPEDSTKPSEKKKVVEWILPTRPAETPSSMKEQRRAAAEQGERQYRLLLATRSWETHRASLCAQQRGASWLCYVFCY